MGDEFLIAAKEDASASRDIRVGLSLLRLPLGRPEPSLVGINRPLNDPAEKNPGALHGGIRQLIHQLVQLRLRHEPILTRRPARSARLPVARRRLQPRLRS